MKKNIFALSFLLFACSSTPKDQPLDVDRSPQGESSPMDVAPRVLDLYEKAKPIFYETMEWRKSAQKTMSEVIQLQAAKKPLPEEILARISAEGRRYLDIRKRSWPFVNQFLFLVESDTEVIFDLSAKSGFQKVSRVSNNASGDVESTDQWAFVINPKDARGRNNLFGLRISLAAALVLSDNYLLGVKPYADNDLTRRILTRDVEQNTELEKLSENFFSLKHRKNLSRAMALFNQDYQWQKKNNIELTEAEKQINSVILNSEFYNFMLSNNYVATAHSHKLWNEIRDIKDSIKFATRASTFVMSAVFGNVVGAVKVEDRKGYMKFISVSEKESIVSRLRPFDILLEKTPHRLTDQFIPGYYGHVAIWLGTEDQLKQENLWDLIPSKIQKEIRSGHTILEALRPGVQINSLDHFLDIDDLLAIRQKMKPDYSTMSRYLKNALAQIGKDYDFNFDVETSKRIVCSEIAYVVFDNLKWPTEKIMGRFSISPDNVVAEALPGGRFEPVFLYKNGRAIHGNLGVELNRLIKTDYAPTQLSENSIYRRTNEPQNLMLLSSGIASLKKRLDMINSARESIELEFFIYEIDEAGRAITQALVRKASQDKVRIRVLVDSSVTVFQLKKEFATVMRDNGIEVRYFNTASVLSQFRRASVRNHRKTLIVDGKEAITGGRNIGSDYFDLNPEYNFLDTDVYVSGSLVSAMKESFDAFWYNDWSADPEYYNPKTSLGKNDPAYRKQIRHGLDYISENQSDRDTLQTVNSMGGRLLSQQPTGVCKDTTFISDFPGDKPEARRVFPTLLRLVANTQKSIDIESPYFVLTSRGQDLFGRLIENKKEISLMTNSLASTDATYVAAAFYQDISSMTSRGVKMWIYKGESPRFMDTPAVSKDATWGIHSKRAVIDGHTALIGTYNVDPRSTDLNSEMALVCHNNEEFAKAVLDDMVVRRSQAAPLTGDGETADENFHLFTDTTTSKRIQYKIFKPLVRIPFVRMQL